MVNETKWLKRVQMLSLPAVLPVKSLPPATAPLEDWIEIIREDPFSPFICFAMPIKCSPAMTFRLKHCIMRSTY